MALRSEDLASKDELTVYKCEVEDEEENEPKVVDKLTEEKCSLAQRFYDLFVSLFITFFLFFFFSFHSLRPFFVFVE